MAKKEYNFENLLFDNDLSDSVSDSGKGAGSRELKAMKRKLQAVAMAAGAFWSASSSGLAGFTYNREGNIRYLVTVMKDSLDQNVPLEGLKTCLNEFTFDFGSGTIIKFIMCIVLSAFAVYGIPKICSGIIGSIMKTLKAVKTHVKMPELNMNDIFEKLENVTDKEER